MTGDRYPRYRVFVVKRHGASVVITHRDGHEETWVGFATEDQAEAWVVKKMAKRPQSKNADLCSNGT
jgi:hypothetical protein